MTNGTADLSMALFTRADFPPMFDLGDLLTSDWGALEVTQRDANSASGTWTSSAVGFGSGNLDLLRLSTLAGQACNPAL